MIIEVAGMAQLNKILATLPDKCKNAARKELKLALLDLKGKAQFITPVGETGNLQGSAFEELNPQGYLLGGVVGFAAGQDEGNPEDYAVIQHENMSYKHDAPGEPKFLETPYKENIAEYTDNIAKAIKGALK
jgi:hypothetical protein